MGPVKKLLIAVGILVVAGCSSGTRVDLIPPEFHIRVIPVPGARPRAMTSFTTIVEIDILNRSSETIEVKSILVSSMGEGLYTIPTVIENFNKAIPAGQFDTFPIRAQVIVEQTLTGVEEPVFIRGEAVFASSSGTFRRSFFERVNPSTLQHSPQDP